MALDNKGGPPDVDEIFRQLKNKVVRSMGGDPGPAPGGYGSGINPLWIAVAAVAAVWLLSGFYKVDDREKAVITRFGAYVGQTEPGLRWHIPWPVERAEIVNVTTGRNVEIGNQREEALMLTGDENIVQMKFAVQYVIRDPSAFLFNNVVNAGGNDNDGADLVKQVAETSMRAIVGRSNIDFVLNEGRDQIAAEAKISIQNLLNRYGTGISVERVNLSNIQPPEDVIEAFEDVIKAGKDQERLKSEGEAYRNEVVPKAFGMAERLKQEAQAYELTVVARAQGDAKRFQQIVGEYQKAPAVMRDRLYLDAMQQVLSSTTKVVADQKGSQLLYLPLDKLLNSVNDNAQNTAARPDAATAAATAAPASPVAAPDSRQREREGR